MACLSLTAIRLPLKMSRSSKRPHMYSSRSSVNFLVRLMKSGSSSQGTPRATVRASRLRCPRSGVDVEPVGAFDHLPEGCRPAIRRHNRDLVDACEETTAHAGDFLSEPGANMLTDPNPVVLAAYGNRVNLRTGFDWRELSCGTRAVVTSLP